MVRREKDHSASISDIFPSNETKPGPFALRMKQTDKASMCSTLIEIAWLFLAIPMEFELPSRHPVKCQDLAFALSSAKRGGVPS